jgi:osmoprotectant transport system substrate-binding protein/osmoprotectant transport system permease protein
MRVLRALPTARVVAGVAAGIVVLLFASAPALEAAESVTIGSKNFTESVILAEALRLDASRPGMTIEHRRGMGGSAILWQALRQGSIDAYPEYIGTLLQELLRDLPASTTHEQLAARLQTLGIGISAPIGFQDRYALGVLDSTGVRLQLHTLSDLHAHPELRFVLSNEFMNRADGWPGLKSTYELQPSSLRGVEHSLAYRALTDGAADVVDLYTTDAEIQAYGIRILADDRHYFPSYEAVWLYRLDSAASHPALLTGIAAFAGRISDTRMQQLNAAVQIQHLDETEVARQFLASLTTSASADAGVTAAAPEQAQQTRMRAVGRRVWLRTLEHLQLVGISLLLAIVVGLPLGVAAAKLKRLGSVVLSVTVTLQTIPSLAMLVFMIPLFGIGARPAIATLFLYSLLPIVRNTQTGLASIAPRLLESAASLGLPWGVRLWRIELPLAARTILAGISTAAVINVGTATLGALIGAGGYGEPILTGVRLNDVPLILEGAIPAAALALIVMAVFRVVEWQATPRGLRAKFEG